MSIRVVFRLETFSVVLSLALVVAEPARAQCVSFGDGVPCGGCAYSPCVCLYSGAACPSYNISCTTDHQIVNGIYDLTSFDDICTRMQPCASKFGGQCAPGINECGTYGSITTSGSVKNYTVLGLCGPIG